MLEDIKKGKYKISQQDVIKIKDQYIDGFKQYVNMKKSFNQNKILFRPYVKYELDKSILEKFQTYDFIIQYIIRKIEIRSYFGKKPVNPFLSEEEDNASMYRFQKKYNIQFEIYGKDYDTTFQIQDEMFDYTYLFRHLNIFDELQFMNIVDSRQVNQYLINDKLIYESDINLELITNVDITEYESIIRNIRINLEY